MFICDSLLLHTVDYNVINDCNGQANVLVSAIKMQTMVKLVYLCVSE